MKRDGGATAGKEMHFTGITELLFRSGRGSRLNKLAEACTGIGKAPRREFNAKVS
jgi:hypothetical protein